MVSAGSALHNKNNLNFLINARLGSAFCFARELAFSEVRLTYITFWGLPYAHLQITGLLLYPQISYFSM
jgi:hypothetical protein